MKTRLFLITISLFTLAACNNMELDNEKKDGILVAANISGSIYTCTSTRAVNDCWEKGDMIGISGVSANVNYNNLKYGYQVNTESDFEPAGEDIIYYTNEEAAVFTAYYPYNEIGEVLLGDISNQNESKSFDYLFAGEAVGSAENPSLDFTFHHKMSKIILNIVAGKGLSDADFTQCSFTFSGLHATGCFNTTTGEITFPAESLTNELTFTSGSSITAEMNEGKVLYSFIFFPETVEGGIALDLQMNGNPYGGGCLKTIGNKMVMESGKVYEYTVTVNQKSINISDASFTDWVPEGDFPEGGKEVDAN